MKLKILSIDAWRDGSSWTWNNWYTVGELDTKAVNIDNNRALLKYMRAEGYLTEASKGKVYIDDDQYNLVICERSNHRPLFSIEYGSQR